MRTFKYFSMMLAMLACCIGFAGCSSDDDDNTTTGYGTGTNSIYGTWTQKNDGYVVKITFNTNGTGSFSVTDDNGENTTGSFEFDYDESEKEIVILSTGAWAQENLVGEWDVIITPSTLQLKGYLYYSNEYCFYELKRG